MMMTMMTMIMMMMMMMMMMIMLMVSDQLMSVMTSLSIWSESPLKTKVDLSTTGRQNPQIHFSLTTGPRDACPQYRERIACRSDRKIPKEIGWREKNKKGLLRARWQILRELSVFFTDIDPSRPVSIISTYAGVHQARLTTCHLREREKRDRLTYGFGTHYIWKSVGRFQ